LAQRFDDSFRLQSLHNEHSKGIFVFFLLLYDDNIVSADLDLREGYRMVLSFARTGRRRLRQAAQSLVIHHNDAVFRPVVGVALSIQANAAELEAVIGGKSLAMLVLRAVERDGFETAAGAGVQWRQQSVHYGFEGLELAELAEWTFEGSEGGGAPYALWVQHAKTAPALDARGTGDACAETEAGLVFA
jgi:hypothetical protein